MTIDRGQKLGAEEQEERQSPRFSLIDVSEVLPDTFDAMERVYERAYGAVWIGHDTFTGTSIPHTTQIALLELEKKIVACANLSGRRVSLIGTNPEFQGKGAMKNLLKEIEANIAGTWITINKDSEAMIRVIVGEGLSFAPVNSSKQMVSLFQENPPAVDASQFTFRRITQPFLTTSLERREHRQHIFMTYSRQNAIHANTYQQLLFQSKR